MPRLKTSYPIFSNEGFWFCDIFVHLFVHGPVSLGMDGGQKKGGPNDQAQGEDVIQGEDVSPGMNG
jgi:hypothetical protein